MLIANKYIIILLFYRIKLKSKKNPKYFFLFQSSEKPWRNYSHLSIFYNKIIDYDILYYEKLNTL